MSTDYHLMMEYKESKDGEWKALMLDGKIWESRFWGVSCIKSAFLRQFHGYDNIPRDLSTNIESEFGYMDCTIVDNGKITYEYLDSEGLSILSNFIQELSLQTARIENYYDYRWIISWC